MHSVLDSPGETSASRFSRIEARPRGLLEALPPPRRNGLRLPLAALPDHVHPHFVPFPLLSPQRPRPHLVSPAGPHHGPRPPFGGSGLAFRDWQIQTWPYSRSQVRFSSLSMPASITTVGWTAGSYPLAATRLRACCKVPGSDTVPARISQRRGKPAPSSASPSVISGQSWRILLEVPEAPLRGVGPVRVMPVRQILQHDRGRELALAGGLQHARHDQDSGSNRPRRSSFHPVLPSSHPIEKRASWMPSYGPSVPAS